MSPTINILKSYKKKRPPVIFPGFLSANETFLFVVMKKNGHFLRSLINRFIMFVWPTGFLLTPIILYGPGDLYQKAFFNNSTTKLSLKNKCIFQDIHLLRDWRLENHWEYKSTGRWDLSLEPPIFRIMILLNFYAFPWCWEKLVRTKLDF